MLKKLTTVLPVIVLMLSSTDNQVTAATPYVNLTGDLVIGALFPIHKMGSGSQPCGKIQLEDGVQPLEAMLYTIRQINDDPRLLPGIRLGAIVYDSCDNPGYALEQSLNFLKGFIAHVNEFHKQEFRCRDGSSPKFRDGGFDRVIAVLAAQSSTATLQIATVMRLFSIPQISYMATTPTLSNKDKFPHFFRTVPSDLNEAHAMLEILKRFSWRYVSVIYEDTEYGNHGFETLIDLAPSYSICFSAPQRIDRERFTLEDYDNVVRTITNATEVRVIFGMRSTTLRVLESARRLDQSRRFVWIGSDAWLTQNHREFFNSARNNATGRGFAPSPPGHGDEGENVALEGALAVQPMSQELVGFDEYFTNLTLEHELVNPWWREFLKEYHGCSELPSVRLGDFDADDEENDVSTSCFNETMRKITPETGYKQQKFVHFVRDAVYAVAHALQELIYNRCGRNHKNGFCRKITHIDGGTLSRYIADVSFKDEGGSKFKFINKVDGPPRYSILNYQRNPDGSYEWHVVGNYSLDESGQPLLQLDYKLLRYRSTVDGRATNETESFPKSSCATPCRPDEVKVREKQDACCWRCRKCAKYQFRLSRHRCEDCDWGTRPSEDRSSCVPIPAEYVDYTNLWALVAIAIASFGILLTIFVMVVFWLHSQTPVVKASGREHSTLLLCGTLASFLMTFAIVARPDAGSCAVTRFGIGFCYTLCYATLVTKTNRIHRIFNNVSVNQNFRPPRFTSPQAQLAITGLLTLVEVCINGVWLAMYPPTISYSYPTRGTRIRICEGFDSQSYLVGLIYPYVLIVLCTIYAVKTRKCPEGFNETRYIAFTNYTTMVLWLVFVPLYLRASPSSAIRVVTLALALSLSALVQLGCLFFPKVYIVLRKPEKNTKELVMGYHHQYRNHQRHYHQRSSPTSLYLTGGSRSSDNSGTSAPPVLMLNGSPILLKSISNSE